MKQLSPMRQKILDYISAYTDDNGYPPSVREICQAVGLRSPSTVHSHLKILQDAGLLEKGEGKTRSITLKNHSGILEGDAVIVRRQETADNHAIVVAMLEDEATVKRLLLKKGQVWLMPENPAYDPIDGSQASILGLVVAVYREYRA